VVPRPGRHQLRHLPPGEPAPGQRARRRSGELARHFATRGAKRFDGIGWSATDTGLPRLDGCIGWFEVGIRSRYEEGDHLILVGRIESFEVVGGGPLLFCDSRFARLAETPPAGRPSHR